MNELKGIAKINHFLNEFLLEFDVSVCLGLDFGYSMSHHVIEYALAVTEKEDKFFMDNFHRLAPDIKCDTFLISFLHELGHHMTMPHLSPEDLHCQKIVGELQDELDEEGITEEKEREIHQKYYNLPIEKVATEWAINYMRENTEKIAHFWKGFQEIVQEFYKINNITE